MRTVVCTQPGTLTLEDRPAPECGPNEARRVGMGGVVKAMVDLDARANS